MAKSVKTPRRLTTAQSAVATAAGVHPKDVHSLTDQSDGESIVVIEMGKSKGGNCAGYMVQLHDSEGKILEVDNTLYPVGNGARTAILAGRKRWGSAEVDEGKALMAFFSSFTKRWNDFNDLKKNDRLDESTVLTLVNKTYRADSE